MSAVLTPCLPADGPAPGAAGLCDLESRYEAFMAQPPVAAFLRDGGRVFLATEGRDAAVIGRLLAAGHRHFAEKFVLEALRKWPGLRRAGVVLHGYGHLQRNKLGRALRVFDVLESVGRDALTDCLARRSALPPLCIQVNVGLEPQKGGYPPARADAALERMRRLKLPVEGVMAIPPRGTDPRPYFRWLRTFAERNQLRECIMGMSGDYRQAIDCGATALRIGRAVLGAKP